MSCQATVFQIKREHVRLSFWSYTGERTKKRKMEGHVEFHQKVGLVRKKIELREAKTQLAKKH